MFTLAIKRDLKIRGRRQRRKRCIKSEFAFRNLHREYKNSLTLSNVGELS